MSPANSIMLMLNAITGFNFKQGETTMPEKTFEQVLIERDNYTPEDADDVRHEVLDRMINGEDPFEVLGEYGLEPDYLESVLLG